MAETGFVTHPACVEHDAGSGHPERPERLVALLERLRGADVWPTLATVEARRATSEELARVHDAPYVALVREASERAPRQLDPDTRVSAASYEAALYAAGGLLDAVERVLDGRWKNAFCGVRPPGHHAERDRAMGFCLFNNVAVAAAALRRVHGLERVAILDWDVHHGNGTQHAFETDPSVFFASLHQWPLYPGTGSADERGRGEGEGTTLNCPLAAGTGNADWLDALERRVLPELEAFRPQFVLVSAGFDAHRRDPLGSVNLDEDGYRALTRSVLDVAARTCAGRVVSVLEGGYDLEALAASAEAHLETLSEAPACA